MNHIKRFASVLAAGALSLGAFAVDNPVDYVNPLMGTDSKFVHYLTATQCLQLLFRGE